jgi:hypothetical protein
MRLTTIGGAVLMAVLGLAAPALAVNAETVFKPGDKVYGDIETTGEVDRLTFEAPRDAELTFKVTVRDPGLVLSLALYPPDAPTTPEPIDPWLSVSSSKVKLKSFPIRVSGDWVLEIRAAVGTRGRYKLKTKIEVRETWKSVVPVGAEEEVEIPFAAPAGARLKKIRVEIDEGDIDPAISRLRTPTGSIALPADLEQGDIPLEDPGEHTLVVENLASVAGALSVKIKVKPEDHDGLTLYLSPQGYGSAPEVDSRDPKKALQDALVSDVAIEGSDFDPAAVVYLRREGQADVPAADVVVVSNSEITCSLDLAGLKAGTWDLVVENPCGGDDDASFKIKKPSDVDLPDGVTDDTEVWFLEFGDEFEGDLALFGLSSTSDSVAEKAAETVKAYILYDLREIFGLKGSSGKVRDDAVALSFLVEEPTALIGVAGEAYNRLRIGGEIQPGDPASDNPYVAWGYSDVDVGNRSMDDLSSDGGAGRGLFLRALNPYGATVTPAWQNAFADLIASPLTALDRTYFKADFDPSTTQESERYAAIDGAIRTLAREVAAIAAHHIARAMGLPNGASGISSTPAAVGTFAGVTFPEFAEEEIEDLVEAARASDLPGSSGKLTATYLPLRGLADFLLPEVVSATTVAIDLPYAGGRPDLRSDDVEYEGRYGYIPMGFSIDDGSIGGYAPYMVDLSWYYGVLEFGIQIEDTVTGDRDRPDHRINLVINLDHVPAVEQAQAQALNDQVRTTP